MVYLLEAFRFEEESEIQFKVFSLEKRHPGKLHCTFIHQKRLHGDLPLTLIFSGLLQKDVFRGG